MARVFLILGFLVFDFTEYHETVLTDHINSNFRDYHAI
jgi:hypothetical protein